MGWLIAMGILALIALMPVGLCVRYDEDGCVLRLLLGLIRIQLFPRDKKEKPKKKKQKAETPKKAPATQEKKPKEKSGGSLRDFWPLIQTGLSFLQSFFKKLRVKRLDMKITLAADDPCDLAVNYGRTWAALGNLMPQLERILVIKKRDLQVQCDFAADQTVVTFRMDVTILVAHLVSLAVKYGLRAFKQYMNLTNLRKGGSES